MIVSISSVMKLRNEITKQIGNIKGQINPKNHKTDFLLIWKVRVAINAPTGTISK